ncbi:FAD-binding oxidoreductase [Jannaschia sp. LMIT008]|uniref:FAD-binding oxidoreductase n=1 Tax=Jannaschia maritima TaxID=3032585 RepID=UPI002810EB64|nr:FAD-binding oxidoreductase [Jannaschia sp. LMIT008]
MATPLQELRDAVGDGHVLTGSDTDRFARDWTGKWQAHPLAVVRPGDTEQVADCVRIAARHGLSVVPVGGNTGLVGGTANEGALMLSLERMDRIREIRDDARLAVVEAGVVLSDLHDAADAHGMVFPLTFGARGSARIGGALSTNAGGSNVVRYGPTRNLCLGLEVVLADGRVLDLMSELHKDNSGYDLRDLFIGAEGTLGIVTGAVLRLHPRPAYRATALAAVRDLPAALRLLHVLQRATDGAVEAFEYMPSIYMRELARVRPDLRQPFEIHNHTIMVEIASLSRPVDEALENVLADAAEEGGVLDAVVAQSEQQRTDIWAMREAAAEVTFTRLPIVDNDVCLPIDRIAEFYAAIDERLAAMDPGAEHLSVSHLGDGNVHLTLYPTRDDPDHLDALRAMVEDVTVALRGSISAEHGIGLAKLATMRRRKDGVALDVMRAIKAALDPDDRMNPGKVVPGA